MENVTIYGKENCNRCDLAKRLLPDAEYANHASLFDRYDIDTATEIVTASGGQLPIIVIESTAGRLVLGASEATKAIECKDGVCSI